jgi:RimJ/RimL family protein N-acetyltransferase
MNALAAELPDIPRWIETRAMLLSGRARLFGGSDVREGFVVRLCDNGLCAAAVVGSPGPDAVREATADTPKKMPVIAQTENADALVGALQAWHRCTAVLHVLRDTTTPVVHDDENLRVLLPDEEHRLRHLPADLRAEMTTALRSCPIMCAFVDDRPVSFCYPCWRTETLWDISIDTLAEHRGQGYAERCTRAMIVLMRRQGLEPVWGAMEWNEPSLRLAAKLGFVAVDRVQVFSRDPSWVFYGTT